MILLGELLYTCKEIMSEIWICYNYFVRNFANFFDLEIFRDDYFVEVIDMYSYCSYLGVVFLNYNFYGHFCLVNFGLFS